MRIQLLVHIYLIPLKYFYALYYSLHRKKKAIKNCNNKGVGVYLFIRSSFSRIAAARIIEGAVEISVEGIRVYYLDMGKADSSETVLILQGWEQEAELYAGLAEHLQNRCASCCRSCPLRKDTGA